MFERVVERGLGLEKKVKSFVVSQERRSQTVIAFFTDIMTRRSEGECRCVRNDPFSVPVSPWP